VAVLAGRAASGPEETPVNRSAEEEVQFLAVFGGVEDLWLNLDWVARTACPLMLWNGEPKIRNRLRALPPITDLEGLHEADEILFSVDGPRRAVEEPKARLAANGTGRRSIR
jgi:hypothetical protein